MLLVVYVDDFKLAGPIAHLAKGWELITRYIQMEPPTPVGQFLGCDQKVVTARIKETGAMVRTMEYDMRSFLESCIERYQELVEGPYSKL